MKKRLQKFWKKRKKLIITFFIIVGVLAGAYFWWKKPKNNATTASYSVIEKVGRGDVYTGIKATGQIVVANKLDLDVYKKDVRINKVNVKNGSQVKKGDLLLAFDSVDVVQSLTSSEIALQNARFALEDELVKSKLKNNEVKTAQDNLNDLEREIADYKKKLERVKNDFYTANLSVEVYKEDEDKMRYREKPSVTGTYTGEKGVYEIEIYSSSTDTGYSFRFNGLENGHGPVYRGVKSDLGTKGLSITFPENMRSSDRWKIIIPDLSGEKGEKAQESYDDQIRSLERAHEKNLRSLAETKSEVILAKNKEKRPLGRMRIHEAKLAVSQAKEALENVKKQIAERSIIAPFDGIITGMKNVVVGTKPGSDSSSVTKMGTLVSDKYIINFSLSLRDLSKIKEGQMVRVSLPMYREISSIQAKVDEISILPDNSSVAQYAVRALIDSTTIPESFQLREGVSAEIEVVNSEKKNVLRLPQTALNFEEGRAYVLKTAKGSLPQEKSNEGIIDFSQTALGTEKVFVEIGLRGKNYIELLSGLKEGDQVVSTISGTAPSSKDSWSGDGMDSDEGGEYYE